MSHQDDRAKAAARVRTIGYRLIESLEETIYDLDHPGPRTDTNASLRALIAEWEVAWRAFEIAALAAQEAD